MSAKLTPLLAQYRRIKEQFQDTLLLFRVGDFYEMFYEDAAIGAQALGLTLTSRPHGPNNRVPLAGVPAKALDSYIGRLVAQGFKVAVCDQLEEPSRAKLVVRRDVVEVITPGTVTRPALLEERRNNYLMAISRSGDIGGIAFADVSTGEFCVAETKVAALLEEVQKIDPAELLVPETAEPLPGLPAHLRITRLDDYYFTHEFAFDKLSSHFGVSTLAGFGVGEMTEGICAAGAVLCYLEQTQRSLLPHLRRLTPYQTANQLLLDRITRRNLELVERIHPDESGPAPAGTLLGVLDRTRTPAGTRLLRRWLLAPLLDVRAITERQDAVAELTGAGSALADIQGLLAKVGDLERVASRVALERANGRDLRALADWLQVVPEVKQRLGPCRSVLLGQLRAAIEEYHSIVNDISTTLVDDPPPALTEGGLIRPGKSPELDELRDLSRNTKEFIARLQETERARTGIPNLRVRYNSVFGYYIEVTKSYLALVPKNYIRKQTVLNAERFITPELKEYEAKVQSAEERIKALEFELFSQLRRRLMPEVDRILRLSATLAQLDVLSSLAQVARENGYVRPQVDNSTTIHIKAGRHPVVETMLEQPFIPNDTLLDTEEQQILIITGPNMAGKSTYLRQVALIVVLAQIGSFVPADSAHLGVVDKIFTRIGASDDLARGVSTFLAEMTETANILNNATGRSLVILDEVGRGTATNDGLAIAWATVEHLHGGTDFRPKTLFATHYRELTDLPSLLPRCRNYSFQVHEHKDQVIFLRKLKPGPADKSYGIAVAKLAGLPEPVIRRARELLARLSKAEQLNLSQVSAQVELALAADKPPHPVLARLRGLNPDELSPLQALNLLAELARLAAEE